MTKKRRRKKEKTVILFVNIRSYILLKPPKNIKENFISIFLAHSFIHSKTTLKL